MQPKLWKIGLVMLSIAALPSSGLAAAGTITATNNAPLGGVNLAGTFTVTLRINGYTDPTEIDGFQFNVNYNTNVLSFVGPFIDNDGVVGPDQQWLSKPNQEAAGATGYILDDGNDSSVLGQVKIVIFDGEGPTFPNPERGTLAAAGFLVSFDMMCKAVAVNSAITPSASQDGIILTGVEGAQPGSPAFVGSVVTCVPEPTTWVMLLAGTLGLCVFKFRRK